MAQVLTVTQFVESIRALFRETFTAVTVQGEVTGYRTARNGGLVYFEIKDETSRVLCFALSHEIKVALTDGMEVHVTGSPALFKGNGGFHIRVIEIQLVGEGALRKQFELTKQRLETEGLFRPERKRPLPVFPDVIGIVTSPDAAALTDVQRILKNRWPLVSVKLASVAVQGPGAARQITRAIERFSATQSVDVVILTRGGGSLEDLQAFNDESVARAIFGSSVAVVVGVGHERDITIADFVADVRASTPSNAAERVVPDRIDVLRRLDAISSRTTRTMAALVAQQDALVQGAANRLKASFEQRTQMIRMLVAKLPLTLRTFVQQLTHHDARTGHLVRMLTVHMAQRFDARTTMVSERSTLLQSLSPLAILKRGYSITADEHGTTIHRSAEVSRGDHITTRFGQGTVSSDITEVT